MNKKLVILPIEIWKREIDARLFFALILLEKGFRVMIAEMNDIHMRYAKDAIILYKDHAVWSEVLFKKWIKNNNSIYAFDEEGLIISNEEYYKKFRVSDWSTNNISGIFTWGKKQEDLIREKEVSCPIYRAGNLKLELASKFKNKLKPTSNSLNDPKILVNTRFTYLNGRYASKDSLIHLGILNDQTDFEKFDEFLNSERQIRKEFERFLKDASNDEYSITLRPHPLEDVDYYQEVFKQNSNIRIDNATNLYQQIQNHDVLIHDGCTTAIEASAMESLVLGLRPKNLKSAYDSTANLFSKNFESSSKLLEYIRKIFETERSNDLELKGLDDLVFGWGELKASSIMIDVFNKDKKSKTLFPKKKIDFRLTLKHSVHELNKILFCQLEKIPSVKRLVSGIENINKKYPKINFLELDRNIHKLYDVLKDTNELNVSLKNIKVEKMSSKSFVLDARI